MAPRQYCSAFLCGLWALVPPVPGLADDAEAKTELKPITIGAAAEAVLTLQREGTAAGAMQPLSGEVAARSYRRYLDSFTKPMPEFNQQAGAGVKPDPSPSR